MDGHDEADEKQGDEQSPGTDRADEPGDSEVDRAPDRSAGAPGEAEEADHRKHGNRARNEVDRTGSRSFRPQEISAQGERASDRHKPGSIERGQQSVTNSAEDRAGVAADCKQPEEGDQDQQDA